MNHSGTFSRETHTEIAFERATSLEVPASIPLHGPTLTWEQFVLLNVEMDRLVSYVRTLQYENESLKIKLSLQSEQAKDIETLRLEIIRLGQELSIAKRSALDIPALESRIASLTKENQHFSRQLSEYMQESESWRVKYTKIEVETVQLRELLEGKVGEVEALRTRLGEYSEMEGQFVVIRQEKERLGYQLEGKNKEIEAMRADNVRLSNHVNDKMREIGELRGKLVILEELETRLKIVIRERDEIVMINPFLVG